MQALLNHYKHILNPIPFKGHGKQPPYFEGWYIKVVDTQEHHRFALIPGVFIAKQDSHAFVQVLDGLTGRASYHRYELSEFHTSADTFDVRVGPNHFTYEHAQLNIADADRPVCGELRFNQLTPWPVSWASPGHMGPFAWLPFMEGYHDVVSLNHRVDGVLEIGGQVLTFDGGRGYMEKDRGQAFPLAYVWQQSNHFDTLGTSLVASLALTQGAGIAFRGFIVGLWHEARLYRFATYTGAQITHLRIDDSHVYWGVQDRTHRLEVVAERAEGTLLHAPIRTEMHKRVDETMRATLDIALYRINNERTLIYKGRGRNAGLEVHGDLPRLVAGR
jgi:tocopherol cyclase